ncbi:MAG: sigma-70 family RNA polymerase sigma factor [Coriobacteriales bacterium]|jgi:RNA polymerase sigma-70 factor (ECF subfamily)|nr:sigma-70 family RNA polymerase sigma factor [Coriobacteriales bacterium]
MDREESASMNEQTVLQPSQKIDIESTAEQLKTSQVVDRYQDMVYAIALTHTRHRQDADDVFQEVFMVYHRKQPSFVSEERRKAWLIATTVNCSRQLTTSSWSRKVVPLYDDQSEPLVSKDFSFATDEQDAIFQAMRGLPDTYRTVLHLFYFEDMPISQIAELLDVQAGTVRVQLTRGRAMLRPLLKGDYFDE